MREILFRGKLQLPDSGEWVEGYVVKGSCMYILTAENVYYMSVSVMGHASVDVLPVKPETVGQYTGMKDKNGKRIFEGDVVDFKATIYQFERCVIEYSASRSCFVAKRNDRCYVMSDEFSYVVIGNIHDNPELGLMCNAEI